MASDARVVPPAVPSPTAPVTTTRLSAVARRVRLQRALDAGSITAQAALGCAALGLVAWKTGDRTSASWAWWIAAALPLVAMAVAWLRPLSPLLCARLLDRAGGTPDLIASSWSFLQLRPEARSSFMQACVEHAERHARSVRAADAAPWRAPRGFRALIGLAVAVTLLWALPLARPQHAVARVIPKPRLLHEDDLSAVRQEVATLRVQEADDPELRALTAELNQLLEALHDGERDGLEALRALRELEQRLALDTHSEDDQALREALKGLGRQLGEDEAVKPLADALLEADAARARDAAERLAAKVEREPPSAAAQKKLARSLPRKGEQATDATADRRKQLKDEIDRLLKKKQQEGALSEQEQRLLEKKQRELDKLEREQQQRERAARELDKLERNLDESKRALDQGQSQQASQAMQRSAQELQRMAQKQMTSEQRERLQRTLEQLRELISKQQKGQGQQGKDSSSGEQGEGQAQQGGQRLDLSRFARMARGQQGGESQDSQGKGEQGNGQQMTRMVPGDGQGDGQPALLQADGDSPGQSSQPLLVQPGGDGVGEGGSPEALAAPTQLDGKRVDTRVQGTPEGNGPTRSQVIFEAGEHGFASRNYERVHTDYSRHAESVLEHDRVPGGYRFYVRRYFQLIRPRTDSEETHE